MRIFEHAALDASYFYLFLVSESDLAALWVHKVVVFLELVVTLGAEIPLEESKYQDGQLIRNVEPLAQDVEIEGNGEVLLLQRHEGGVLRLLSLLDGNARQDDFFS